MFDPLFGLRSLKIYVFNRLDDGMHDRVGKPWRMPDCFREEGVCSGLATLPCPFDEFDADLDLELLLRDGQRLTPGEPIAYLKGSVRDLLTSERTILNILGRLCGIATLAARFVEAISQSQTRVYDTRKRHQAGVSLKNMLSTVVVLTTIEADFMTVSSSRTITLHWQERMAIPFQHELQQKKHYSAAPK